jgi:hypothetical protein
MFSQKESIAVHIMLKEMKKGMIPKQRTNCKHMIQYKPTSYKCEALAI